MIGAVIAVITVALIVRDTVLRVHAAKHRHADLVALDGDLKTVSEWMAKKDGHDEDIAKRLRAVEARTAVRVRA